MKPTFRAATREDAPLLLNFIRAFAEYENLLDEVTATEKLLESRLFDKNAAEVILALVDGKEVGFALFFPNFSTFLGQAGLYLEDLFILPEYRGYGIGKALLAELARIAIDRGYGRMDWLCLNWNEPSIKFYRSLGAEAKDEWTLYRLTGDMLRNLAGSKPTTDKNPTGDCPRQGAFGASFHKK
jgi:GNAT superfamily N-acetyltransferase